MIKIFKTILSILSKKQKSIFYLILVFSLFAAFLEMLGLSLIIPILQIVLGKDNINSLFILKYFKISEFIKIDLTIYGFLFFVFCFYLFKSFILSIFSICKNFFASRIETSISENFFRYYLNSDYSYKIKKNYSQLLKNLTNETRTFRSVLVFFLDFITESIIGLLIIVLLLNYNFNITLLLIVFFIFIVLFLKIFLKGYSYKLGKNRSKNLDLYIKFLLETFNALREIKIFSKDKYIYQRFQNLINRYTSFDSKKSIFFDLTRYMFEVLTVLAICFLVIFSIQKGNNTEETLITLGLFTVSIFRLVPILNRLNFLGQTIFFNLKSIEILTNEFEILKNQSGISGNKIIKNFKSFEMQNIKFSYPESNRDIFKNLNIKFLSKEIIGIEGISGTGKTTLINLISGLLKCNSGKIFINSKDIDLYSINSWHKLIGYAGQNSYLTNESILKNIIYGESTDIVDIQYVHKLIKILDMQSLINSLPKGIDSNVGDFGIKISGGQRQRICIARALYKKPQILILDEPTSSLDLNTAIKIIKSLNNIKSALTIIVISHNLKNIGKLLKFSQKIFIKKN
jgi:ABC-type multidrug transport system fused ATPase/permease subunit